MLTAYQAMAKIDADVGLSRQGKTQQRSRSCGCLQKDRKDPLQPLRRKFLTQRRAAKARGIPFRLTFEEWLEVWGASGHLHERGNEPGQYVMARFGDEGPYEVGNVKIITFEENSREGPFFNPAEGTV